MIVSTSPNHWIALAGMLRAHACQHHHFAQGLAATDQVFVWRVAQLRDEVAALSADAGGALRRVSVVEFSR